MSFGKFRFKSFKQFYDIQVLAHRHGHKTTKEFIIFLEENYSHLKNKHRVV